MAQNLTINDGGLLFPSQVVNIKDIDGTATDYQLTAFSLEFGSNFTERTNAAGVPDGQYGAVSIPTGSATATMSASKKLPGTLEVFDAVDASGKTVKLIVASVSQGGSTTEQLSASLTLRRLLNANPDYSTGTLGA